VQDTHALVQQHTSEGLPSQGQASHLEATADKLVGSDGIAASVETVTVNATIEDVPLAVNDSERCVDGSTEPSVVENPVQINGPLVDAQGNQLISFVCFYFAHAMVTERIRDHVTFLLFLFRYNCTKCKFST